MVQLKDLELTKVNIMAQYLTQIESDWSEHLPEIQSLLQEGESIVSDRTNSDSDPLFATPNLPNVRGYVRWAIIPRLFELGIAAGRFPGITGEWICLGGVHIFEIQAQNTKVTPYHMRNQNETPRESTFRKNGRIENAISPFLNGFEPEEAESGPMNLLLVYGGGQNPFAFLRAYYDREHRSVYRPISNNIMLVPSIVTDTDAEVIADPEITFDNESVFNSGEDTNN